MTIQALPRGVVAGIGGGNWGLLALMANLNNYAVQPQPSAATSGTSITLTAAQVCNGALILTSGASGAFTINLPSTASILAVLGPTIPTDGTYGEKLYIQNNGVGQTGTVTAGDSSTTLSGTMTIATNTTRMFLLSVTSAGAITLTNYGSMAL